MKPIRLAILCLCLLVLIVVSGCLSAPQRSAVDGNETSNEVEATVYNGIELTPIDKQGNNAIKGTQYVDRNTYRLQIDGLVENPTELTYDQILEYPSTSKVVDMNCVEGWGFTAKWTGVLVETLFNDVVVKENATTVIFYCADGYSTSHDLNYLLDNDIMLAYRINDVTLPQDRGFPFNRWLRANMATNGRNGSPVLNLRMLSTVDTGRAGGTVIGLILEDLLLNRKR